MTQNEWIDAWNTSQNDSPEEDVLEMLGNAMDALVLLDKSGFVTMPVIGQAVLAEWRRDETEKEPEE